MPQKQFSPLKLLKHLDRVQGLMEGKNIYPVTVELDASNVCNHDCIWCTFDTYRSIQSRLMPKELMFRVVRELAEVGVKSILWTGGGEPLINTATLDAMDEAIRFGMKNGLYTNGALLDETKVERVIEYCSFVRFSIDAATTKTHHHVHKTKSPDEFDKIISNIQRLIDLRNKKGQQHPTVGYSFLVHSDNLDEIVPAARLAKDIGCDYFQLKPVVNYDGPQLTPDLLKIADREIAKAEKIGNKAFDVISLSYKFSDISDPQKRYGRDYRTCIGHAFLGTIASNGDVFVCCHKRGMPRFKYGNLNEKSFQEIWESAQRKLAIDRIDVSKCHPLCKAHEFNKLLHRMRGAEKHPDFL